METEQYLLEVEEYGVLADPLRGFKVRVLADDGKLLKIYNYNFADFDRLPVPPTEETKRGIYTALLGVFEPGSYDCDALNGLLEEAKQKAAAALLRGYAPPLEYVLYSNGIFGILSLMLCNMHILEKADAHS